MSDAPLAAGRRIRPPYDQLYIYEMAGDARPWTGGLGAGFLGLWLEGDSSFLFFSRPAGDEVEAILAQAPSLALSGRHQLSYEQWQGGMDLPPLMVGDLWVATPWSEAQPPPGRRALLLDPGLVFGNGLHPTTRDCLEMLHARRSLGPLGRVLDLGCGTGILALAAAAWEAEAVLALDLNPLCVSTTRNNALLNGLDLEVAEGPAGDFLDRPAEVILANLHWDAQKDLWTRPGALDNRPDLILSGVTRSYAGPLTDLLAPLGYRPKRLEEADFTWFTTWFRAA